MKRTVNILIVGTRNLFGRMGERTAGTGICIRTVADHREAAEAILAHPTDVLIIEIASPQAVGLLKYVNDNFGDIRVILTADDETGEVIRTLRYGKYKFLSDPLMLPELRDIRMKGADCKL